MYVWVDVGMPHHGSGGLETALRCGFLSSPMWVLGLELRLAASALTRWARLFLLPLVLWFYKHMCAYFLSLWNLLLFRHFFSGGASSQCTPRSVHPPPFYHPTHMQSKVTTGSQANSKWPRQTPGLWLPWSVAGEQDFHCNAELCSGGELHLWSPLGVTPFHRF